MESRAASPSRPLGQPANATLPTLGGTAAIDLAPGETVQCTFTNTGPNTIEIIKNTVPDSGQDFAFTTTGGLTPATFSLDDDADGTLPTTQTYTYLKAGTYTETEPAVDGSTTSPSCTDLSGSTSTAGATATIGLAPGETVTCLYTNTAQPVSNLADLAIGIAAPNQLAPVGKAL